MSYNIKETRIAKSKISEYDIESIPMGIAYTDHIFVCDFEDGKWQYPRIEPMGLIPTHPASMALHYGQAIFEGLKATSGKENQPILFRPEQNAKRFNRSADRMAMPEIPEDLFLAGLTKLLKIDHQWVPKNEGSALYVRPFMYADEPFIGMRAATKYKFIIMASPAGPYFSRPIKLYAESKYVRAVNGGTGEAKAAGNYAAAIRPTELAKSKGYDQVLWLDAHEFEYIQEVGTMNIFFKIAGKIITPNLNGSVLAGVTRMSVIELLRDKGYQVEERQISMTEIKDASVKGTLEECFGVGTAVGIAMVEEIGNAEFSLKFPAESPVAHEVQKTLTQIKTQQIEDKFGWIVPITINPEVKV